MLPSQVPTSYLGSCSSPLAIGWNYRLWPRNLLDARILSTPSWRGWILGFPWTKNLSFLSPCMYIFTHDQVAVINKIICKITRKICWLQLIIILAKFLCMNLNSQRLIYGSKLLISSLFFVCLADSLSKLVDREGLCDTLNKFTLIVTFDTLDKFWWHFSANSDWMATSSECREQKEKRNVIEKLFPRKCKLGDTLGGH